MGLEVGRPLGLAGQFIQKSARDRIAGFAPFAARQRQGKGQSFLRSSDADVTQSSFLVDRLPFFVHAAVMWQDPFFQAHHVDVRELQSFRAVEGHERHRIASKLVFLVVIEFSATQSDIVEKVPQFRRWEHDPGIRPER